MTQQIHELKAWPEYWEAVKNRRKPFEVRRDDRGFRVGDVLNIHEWDPTPNIAGHPSGYTGRMLGATVSYKLDGGQFGIKEGYCVLGLGIVQEAP